jgi:uncharacterized protein YndB with AHSA1/START domain
MPRIIVTQTIDAPVERVFTAVADIKHFSQAVPQIIKVQFLTETETGVGTRFRETRLMKGKETRTELEVTEYVENDRIRLVADSHGTVWDTLFAVRPESGQTVLIMTMEARAYRLLPRLMNPLIARMIRHVIVEDLKAVKTFCER